MAQLKSTEIAAALRRRIDAGDWAETQLLPNERALSAGYGVARNTMRRAVETLVAAGRVTRHVGRGTRILSGDADEVADLARIVRTLAGTSPLDIMNMRLIIEPQAASAAAANASAAEMAAILDAHDQACATTDMAAFEKWDMELHRRIFLATRNELLRHLNDILATIRSQPRIVDIRRRGFSEVRRLETCAQHRAVVAGLTARDAAAAAEAMKAHLTARSRTLFGGSIL